MTMPTTPGEGFLDVIKEAETIKNYMGNYSAVRILERPTAKQILEILPNFSIACTLLVMGFLRHQEILRRVTFYS